MKQKFPEAEIKLAFREFRSHVLKQLGVDGGASKKELPLVLEENLRITKKQDLQRANGRYRFKLETNYRDCYIPHAESAGVYIFFDQSGCAVYVGKSEPNGGLGRRISSHIGQAKDNDFSQMALEKADYVIVIPFSEAPYLAPAFESFLLSRFEFAHNIVGRS